MGLEQEEKIMTALEGGMKEGAESVDPEEEKEESKMEELEEKLEDERRKNALPILRKLWEERGERTQPKDRQETVPSG